MFTFVNSVLFLPVLVFFVSWLGGLLCWGAFIAPPSLSLADSLYKSGGLLTSFCLDCQAACVIAVDDMQKYIHLGWLVLSSFVSFFESG